jgi:hypothetical protein
MVVCPRIASTDLDDLTCKAIDGQELSRRGHVLQLRAEAPSL